MLATPALDQEAIVMKILIIGSGGREHAICWKLAQSPRKPKLFCAPGNAGIAQLATTVPIPADDIDSLLKFASKEKIDLTFVGPEDPLCAGIVDRFSERKLRIFGPTMDAAKLEGDKSFAKQIMRDVGVPTAEARIFGPTAQEIAQARQRGPGKDEAMLEGFQRGYDMARSYLETRDEGVVIKACGLAKGKGVFVHPDPADGLRTLERLMVEGELGAAGQRLIIEELLTGPEVSVQALVDGQTIYALEPAADHKRLGDNDTGLNTGGMGAYSPSTTLDQATLDLIQREIFVPVVDALKRDDTVYRGVLYAGIMMTTAGPKVLEFNCRLGDPETQPLMMRLRTDLLDVIEATIDGRLDQITLEWDPRPAVCVVMASDGYPGAYEKGRPIKGLDSAGNSSDAVVFHSGTAMIDDRIVTSGGRVLGVTALGGTLTDARSRAYELVDQISFEGMTLRRDIAARACR